MCEECIECWHDNKGRPWALVSEVKEGSILIADEGFISDPENGGVYNKNFNDWFCIQPGKELVVKVDCPSYEGDNGLYVDCSAGGHMLYGQFEEDPHGDFYMGFYLKD